MRTLILLTLLLPTWCCRTRSTGLNATGKTVDNGQCLQQVMSRTSQAQKRFSQNQAHKFCQRKASWTREILSRSAAGDVELTKGQQQWFRHFSTIQNASSFQLYLRQTGALPKTANLLKPAHRREVRTLQKHDWDQLLMALNQLKLDSIDGLSKYDIFTIMQGPKYAPGAYFGPAFLPFHREALKNFELALRVYDPEVSIPFWDSSLDECLPEPADSIVWTERFFGNVNGYVNTSPFGPWITLNTVFNEKKLVREAGKSPYGGLYKAEDISVIMGKSAYEQLTSCVDPFFELCYGGVNLWVGGHMKKTPAAPEDPVFYFNHAFVDYLWEQFRQKRQTESSRAHDYPTDSNSCNANHYAQSSMKPYDLKNIDGLSDVYTNEIYTYGNRPTCTEERPSCESEYLFCDLVKKRCVSKVKNGGKCSGFENTDICYEGSCVDGKCKSLQSTGGVQNKENQIWPTVTRTPNHFANASECWCSCDCFTNNGQKQKYMRNLPLPLVTGQRLLFRDTGASGDLEVSKDVQWVWMMVNVINRNDNNFQKDFSTITVTVRGIDYAGTYSTPVYDKSNHASVLPGSVFVQVKNPSSSDGGRVEFEIVVDHSKTGPCDAFCYQQKDEFGFKQCDPRFTLESGKRSLFPYASTLEDLVSIVLKRPSNSVVFICSTTSNFPLQKKEEHNQEKCYYLRFENFLLAGFADAVQESTRLGECKEFCRRWLSSSGQSCQAFMHWNDDGTCILLINTRKTAPYAFVHLPQEPVTYYEKTCSLYQDAIEV